MADRRDALLGAALVIVRARELAGEPALHTTVSKLNVQPNSPVVVARQVICNLDLRSPDPDALETGERLLRQASAGFERAHGVSITLDRTHHWDRNDYAGDGIEPAEEVCVDLGLASHRILTVVGHDSTNLKDVTPTVMLFVPSRDGISHNECECTSDTDMLERLRTEVPAVPSLLLARGYDSPRWRADTAGPPVPAREGTVRGARGW